MSSAGTQNIQQDQGEELACWIHGRGGAQQTMAINSVGRWISTYEVTKFTENLLLKGKCNL